MFNVFVLLCNFWPILVTDFEDGSRMAVEEEREEKGEEENDFGCYTGLQDAMEDHEGAEVQGQEEGAGQGLYGDPQGYKEESGKA